MNEFVAHPDDQLPRNRGVFGSSLFRDEPCRFTDRITGEEVTLTRAGFDDLCRVHLYDWLEQVPRSKWWDYRRAGYRRLAARLGGVAQEWYDRTFAAETAGTGP